MIDSTRGLILGVRALYRDGGASDESRVKGENPTAL